MGGGVSVLGKDEEGLLPGGDEDGIIGVAADVSGDVDVGDAFSRSFFLLRAFAFRTVAGECVKAFSKSSTTSGLRPRNGFGLRGDKGFEGEESGDVAVEGDASLLRGDNTLAAPSSVP